MSAVAALWIVTWTAIVLLLLAVGAVMREVRLLRRVVEQNGYSSVQPTITFDPALVQGRDATVVAADARCPMCVSVTNAMIRYAEAGHDDLVVLTHEAPEVWQPEVRKHLSLIRDPAAWTKIAHLTPPVIMSVAGDGSIRDMVLPVTEDVALSTLHRYVNAPRRVET